MGRLVCHRPALRTVISAWEVTMTVVRTDASGKPFRFFGGDPAFVVGKAPSFLRRGLTRSGPLMFSNVWRALRETRTALSRDALVKYAPEELDMSDRLIAAGYTMENPGSILVPLGSEFIDGSEEAQDLSALKKEIGEREVLSRVDSGEIAWL